MKNRLSGAAALVIAHPGHELRIYGWLEMARPVVFVLTDGSGRSGRSRLDSTTRILGKAGARTGSVYGGFTDPRIYAAILKGDVESFTQVVLRLGEAFRDEGIEYVVADAAEGFNPCHDLCRYLVDAAVAWAAKNKGRTLANYDFLLEGRPDSCPASLREQAIHLALDEGGFQRKVKAVSNYPELKDEVHAAVARFGPAVFRTECLRPVSYDPGRFLPEEDPPYYERYGEQQVAAGFYTEVIRYRRNVLPLVRAVRRRLDLENEDGVSFRSVDD